MIHEFRLETRRGVGTLNLRRVCEMWNLEDIAVKSTRNLRYIQLTHRACRSLYPTKTRSRWGRDISQQMKSIHSRRNRTRKWIVLLVFALWVRYRPLFVPPLHSSKTPSIEPPTSYEVSRQRRIRKAYLEYRKLQTQFGESIYLYLRALWDFGVLAMVGYCTLWFLYKLNTW